MESVLGGRAIVQVDGDQGPDGISVAPGKWAGRNDSCVEILAPNHL